jgi:hypothetical protein
VKGRTAATGAVAAALCLAGCAGGSQQRAAPPAPRLPHTLAGALASHSDAIAQALDAGDACRAASLARVLQAQTIAAINNRRVPAAFQEPLASAVTDLTSRIRCVPPPVEQPGQGQNGKGKAKGKHKHNEGGD